MATKSCNIFGKIQFLFAFGGAKMGKTITECTEPDRTGRAVFLTLCGLRIFFLWEISHVGKPTEAHLCCHSTTRTFGVGPYAVIVNSQYFR